MPTSAERTPLIGREHELAALLGASTQAATGQGGLVLVGGEPGIGKTRLVLEHAGRARAAGWQVLLGRAYDTAGMPPYLPFAEALRPYVRSSPPQRLRAQLGGAGHEVALLVPDVHQRLSEPSPSTPLSPEHARYRLFEGVTDFLLAIARDEVAGDGGPDAVSLGPDAPPPAGAGLLLVLEDLHWADAPTLQLLLHLARRLGEASLLVVGTHRTVDLGPAHPLTAVLADLQHEQLAERVPLAPFSIAEAATLMTAVTGGPVAPEVARAIYQETEGLPFFLEEVIRQLRLDGRDLSDAQGIATGTWGLPEGVQQAIGRRLARLSPAAYELVQAGAVLGDGFDFEVAAAMCRADPAGAGAGAGRHDPLLNALDEALVAGVVREEGAGYQFHHALIRRNLVDTLTLPRRQRLHLRAAEALEQVHARDLGPHAGALATHYRQAGPAADRETTIRYLLLAAEASAATFAWEEAAARWQAALELIPSDDDERRCPLLVALGEAQQLAGDSGDAQQSFRDAADVAKRTAAPEHLARAALGFAHTVVVPLGSLQQVAVALLEDALDVLDEGDSTPRARVLGQLAWMLELTAPWEQWGPLSGRAVAMARRLGDPLTLGVVLGQHYWALAISDAGARDERQAIIAELLSLAEWTGDPTSANYAAHDVYQFQVVAALEAGDAVAAEQAIDRYDALAHRLRTAYVLERALQLRAMREMMTGRLAAAADLIGQVAARAERMQSTGALQMQVVTYQRRYLYLYQGRAGEAAADLAELRAALPAPQAPRHPLPQAYFLARAGHLEEARTAFEQVAAHDFADVHRVYDEVLTLAQLAETCALLGDARRAALLYRRLLPFRTQGVAANNGIVFHGAVAHYLGLLATTLLRADDPPPAGVGWETAADHFEAALAFHARLGARMWVAHTQVAYATLLRDRRWPEDRRRAQELLDQAVSTFTELGLEHAATAARQVLTVPARTAAPAARPTFPDDLSAREVGVLRLLAAGKSNAEIADDLVLSIRTVERHISTIYGKIGAQGSAARAAATNYALSHRLLDA